METTAIRNVVAYVRVSTAEQGRSGLGIEAQRAHITAEAERRSWTVVAFCQDVASGKSDAGRVGLAQALDIVKAGYADAVIVDKGDRLSRSTLDFLRLLETAQREGWTVHALDFPHDVTTPEGRMMATVAAAFAELERKKIGQRTADALAAAKMRGQRLGRPVLLDSATRCKIVRMRADGMSLSSVAKTLNDQGVPTATGQGTWWPQTIKDVMVSVDLDAAALALA